MEEIVILLLTYTCKFSLYQELPLKCKHSFLINSFQMLKSKFQDL